MLKIQRAATWKLFAASANTAAWELLSESITAGIGGRIGAVANVAGGKKGRELAFQVAKNLAKEFNLEGSSEAISEIASMLGDKAILGKDIPKDWLSRILDTYLIGGILGGGVSTVGVLNANAQEYAKQRLKPSNVREADSQSEQKANDLTNAKYENEKNPNKTRAEKDTTTSLLDDSLNKIVEEKAERDAEVTKTIEKMAPAEIERSATAIQEIDKELTSY